MTHDWRKGSPVLQNHQSAGRTRRQVMIREPAGVPVSEGWEKVKKKGEDILSLFFGTKQVRNKAISEAYFPNRICRGICYKKYPMQNSEGSRKLEMSFQPHTVFTSSNGNATT